MIKTAIDTSAIEEWILRLEDPNTIYQLLLPAAEELAVILKSTLKKNTPFVSGTLRNGWNTGYKITRNEEGFLVELSNSVSYAKDVNYGHPSHNQFNKGGIPYLVRNRIKVPTPYYLQNPKSSRWVWGQFFVEKSLLELENTRLRQVILKALK